LLSQTSQVVSKRFPANTTLEFSTFLNDKKVNGELYALLQSLSYPTEDKMTVVPKQNIPKQSEMCRILGIGSPKTLRTHLGYLTDKGYIEVDTKGNYILPELEDIYFLIPLHTLQYLNDNCKDHVIKIYVYLGQRYKWSLDRGSQYEFSLEELGDHIGIKVKNNSRGYEIINNALNLLYNSGLIDYCSYFNGKSQKKKLTGFSFDVKLKD
jgi:hypothetical protein